MAPPSEDSAYASLRLELRRGCLTLAVLQSLEAEQYGYALRKSLEEAGLDIDEGTLYPLLRRLESHHLLSSQWRERDGRRKRFYRITTAGRAVLATLMLELSGLTEALTRLERRNVAHS